MSRKGATTIIIICIPRGSVLGCFPFDTWETGAQRGQVAFLESHSGKCQD